MRQAKQIMRGCFATFLAVLLILTMLEMPNYSDDPRPAYELGLTIALFVIYGGLLALVVSAVVMLIWAVLARRKRIVPFWAAPLSGAALFGPCLALGSGATGGLVGICLGVAVGAHFWFWAFGLRSPVQMQFRT